MVGSPHRGSVLTGVLQADIVFLDREIKTRKQTFGIEIYDLMEELESNDTLSVDEKEAKIRSSFDAARKDIAVIRAKKDCKKEEMGVIDAQAGGSAVGGIGASAPAGDSFANPTAPMSS